MDVLIAIGILIQPCLLSENAFLASEMNGTLQSLRSGLLTTHLLTARNVPAAQEKNNRTEKKTETLMFT